VSDVNTRDLQNLAEGLAPAIHRIITESVQPLTDLIVAQGKTIAKLEQRVAQLEGEDPDAAAMRAIEQ
jgi:hypothetical protein